MTATAVGKVSALATAAAQAVVAPPVAVEGALLVEAEVGTLWKEVEISSAVVEETEAGSRRAAATVWVE